MDDHIKRYYEISLDDHLEPLFSKDQLLSLVAVVIDLGPEQQEWLEEIKERLEELE